MVDPNIALACWQARGGQPVRCQSADACWVIHERYSYLRVPSIALGPPADEERRELFWHRRIPLISYVEPAPQPSSANALMYVCRDPAYDLERLPKKTRRDVRHGLRSVTVRRLAFDELARLGHPALADTCVRHRAAVPGEPAFAAQCRTRATFASERAWGAFADGELCAWVTTQQIGNVLEMGNVAMLYERRSLCATYALVYEVARAALGGHEATVLAYGLTSVRQETRIASLHQFKTWLGFEAVPVRRVAEFHPLLRPFCARPLLGLYKRLLVHAPDNRKTRKARGLLELMTESATR